MHGQKRATGADLKLTFLGRDSIMMDGRTTVELASGNQSYIQLIGTYSIHFHIASLQANVSVVYWPSGETRAAPVPCTSGTRIPVPVADAVYI